MRAASRTALVILACALAVSVRTAAQALQPAPEPQLTFFSDVAPLLATHCSACHHPGGPAPFSVLSHADVAPRAQDIAKAVESRAMPRWKPEPGFGGPFVGERRLSNEEIGVLRRWADAGAPQGEDSHLHDAEVAAHAGWHLGTPDLVVSLPQSFVLPPGGPDVFRNFAVPLPLSVARLVKGIEFLPGNHVVTHHANIRVDPTAASLRLDERDQKPGYEGIAAPTAVFPDGYFLGWTPGQVATFLPPGLAWRIAPGSTLAVELHMLPAADAEVVDFKIGLYFTDIPPVQTPVMLRLGRQNIDIPPGSATYAVHDEFTLPSDVELLSLQPHAHYLAKEVKGTARLPDGTSKPLIFIKDWDFHIQDVYRYVTPVSLPKGTTVQMDYIYDNSVRNRHNPSSPPVRVRWGQHTTDEMGDLWLQLLPRKPSDFPELSERVRAKQLTEDIVGYRSLLERTPDDALLHANLAGALIGIGKRGEALEHLRAHVRLEPESAIAHYNLATALAATARPDEALAEFRRAIEIEPDDPFAHNGVGGVLLSARRDLSGALVEFETAVRLDPKYPNGFNNIGVTLARMGRPDEAIAAYQKAIAVAADNIDARFNAAGLLEGRGRYAEAARYYREAATLQPDDYRTRLRLAWVLATSPDEATRNPSEARRLAEDVARGRSDDPEIFDTLAAAQAATRDFSSAVRSAQRAVELVSRSGEREWESAVRQRLDLYRQRMPFVVPAP